MSATRIRAEIVAQPAAGSDVAAVVANAAADQLLAVPSTSLATPATQTLCSAICS